MSPRSLNRRFLEQTGTTPNRWLNQVRLQRARELLEATDDPIETIAYAAGFGSPITFRERFTRDVGTSPRDYRSEFRATRARTA
jgi:transcriptional regulator GlxA family with amidase domain